VKTTLNCLSFFDRARKVSITERSAMRLFVVAGSDTQRSRRTISPPLGRMYSISAPAPPGLLPFASVAEARLVGVHGDERVPRASW
jgi:hypothetical protein